MLSNRTAPLGIFHPIRDATGSRFSAMAQMLAVVVTGLGVGIITTSVDVPLVRLFVQFLMPLIPVGILALMTWRRPDIGFIVLATFQPFSDLALGFLFSTGVDVRSVTLARFWKELVLAILIVRLLFGPQRWSDRLDRLDRLILVFVSLVAVYALVPLGPPPLVRVLAARQEIAFLLLFLCARHLVADRRLFGRLEASVLIVGAVISGLTIWNAIAPEAFAQWIADVGLQLYRRVVLGTPPTAVVIYRHGGEGILRAGSIFLSATTLAFYLLIPLGVAIASILRGRARWWHVLCGAATAVALMLTLTRSALAAVPLMLGIAWLTGRRRAEFSMLVLLILAALLPIASSIGVGRQLQTAFDPEEESRASHVLRLQESISRVRAHPFGTGLGTAGSISRRFSVSSSITNENWYFQVGTELGIVGMGLFLAIILGTISRLWRRAREGFAQAVGPLCSVGGVATGALVLLTLEDFSVAWTLWILCGVALNRALMPRSERPELEVGVVRA